jgi:hypothetical protein
MEYYAALKEEFGHMPQHKRTLSLKLYEISQSQKDKYYIIPLIYDT